MGQPVWEKITPDGKPFGHKTDKEKELEEKVKGLEEQIIILKEENKQILELLEGEDKEDKKDNKIEE